MAYRIEDIEGIGPSYGAKLAEAGIRTTADLLKHCAEPSGRAMVAQRTAISEGQLLKWTNLADLMRISGVGSEYSELLEAAGVDTIKELRNRNAENLASKIREVNQARRLSRATPGLRSVQKWVDHASRLTPVITY